MSLIKLYKLNIKKICSIENMLCLFIVICPILDVSSFLFRKYFNTSFSISTFIRPIIPLIVIFYIFFKYKIKFKIIVVSLLYMIYAVIHIFIFYKIKNGCAYGNEFRELQYLVNYTFMILNLFIYFYLVVIKNDSNKTIYMVKVSVLISLGLYILFMYLALITKTSSFTYPEESIGYKGWFESGNSIGNLMLLSLFIVLPMINKKYNNIIRISALIISILVGTYLTTLLGTRTGLFGLIILIITYITISIIHGAFHNKNINNKVILIGISCFVVIGVIIFIFGSKTIERRRNLKEKSNEIYDQVINEPAHVTGDMINIVKQINDGKMDEKYMSKDMQETYIAVYNIANEKKIDYTDMRSLQYIYHTQLIKRQHNFALLLFGNGYMTHFYEMIFEMEVLAFLFNFGIIGFLLYFVPFLSICIYLIYYLLKNIHNISVEYIMDTIGICFAIILSLLSGYTFFNASTMLIIIILCTCAIKNTR